MAKVKCIICGNVFEEGPEKCPMCGVGPDLFEPYEEEEAPEVIEEAAPAAAPAEEPAEGEKKMVKCLVCGAVFEEGADVCPVCGVGPENFLEISTEKTSFRNDTDEKFVIIGGGPAAKSAAEAIRDRNKTAMITIISKEPYLPYNRPILTKWIVRDFDREGLAVEGPEWYERNNIFFMGNTTVDNIDTDKKYLNVSLAGGNHGQVQFDKLIYALGAFCFVPPIKGSDLDHVVTIRNIADTDKVKKIIVDRGATKAVCIGGGVMGLEGAWGLKEGGLDVTVLETAPGLLPRQLDDPASGLLEHLVAEAGVNIVTGAKIVEITPDAVVLDDGTEFEAQLVIMSTGMRPYTKVAEDSGIAVDKWVVADTKMQTNIPGVYAAGDCAVINGQPQAFWAQAAETGRIAGANATGDDIEYVAIGSALAMEAMNTSVFALGTNGKDPGRKFRTVEFKDEVRGMYEKYYFFEDKLEGVILIGDTSKKIDLTEKLDRHASYEEIFG